ncbi:GntR family transcriptional regulator [Clostridiales bacterium COT073_COT-073]|nr:GntR family transcriptional regulator [Clostridiales bacterium COT073_COT-073]
MDLRLPKYYQVKKAIAEKIENGDFSANEQIPSERELMDSYKVSRITIRKAIDELVTEGYLYKIQGKGTYVKTDEGSSNLFAILSCTEDVMRLGMKPSKKLVVSDVVKAGLKKAKALEIDSEDSLYMVGRIMYADQEPLNYTVTFLPVKLFPDLPKHELAEESLYEMLQVEYGVKITKARRTMEAILAKDEIAEYLELKEGSPIILFRCITYGIANGKEIPIENFKCYYRTDKFKFYIDQVR